MKDSLLVEPIVTFQQVESAAKRLNGYAHKTPVMTSQTLNKKLNCKVYFKCENFQKVGAFKFRGAFNAMSQLNEKQKAAGVIAYSSGNHAQAIACVGKLLGVATTIVMPQNAPVTKLAATRGYGAKVITFDPEQETRESVADVIIAQAKTAGRPLNLIPPFDFAPVIAGQGTAALEFLHEVPTLETLLVPCGGGGLLSGSALAAKGFNDKCQVIGVEPIMADDAYQSFKTGKLHSNPNPPTIADGTRTTSLGELTFPLIRQNVDDMVTVSEEAICEAVRFFYYHMKLVVEPSGALGLAAFLSGAFAAKGSIGIIISGGNIDGPTMAKILT